MTIWHDLFVAQLLLIEKIIRPIIVYFFLLFLIRFGGKREIGSMTAFDIIVLLVLGNAVQQVGSISLVNPSIARLQNAIIGEDYSLMGGLIDAVILMICNYVMVRLSYHFNKLQRLIEGTPTLLVRDGKAIARHLAKEAITEKELRSKLSQKGFENIADVRLAILETDGTMTVERYPSCSEDNRHRELSNRLNKIEELLSQAKSKPN